jgi:hypothetical protein
MSEPVRAEYFRIQTYPFINAPPCRENKHASKAESNSTYVEPNQDW